MVSLARATCVSFVLVSAVWALPADKSRHTDSDFANSGLTDGSADAWLSSPAGREKLSRCLPLDAIPIEGKNLTASELELLPSICWRGDVHPNAAVLKARDASRIPDGVRCKETQWYVT